MIRLPDDIKAEAVKAIRIQLKKGDTNWGPIRERWPEYFAGPKSSPEERRFFRLLREVRTPDKAPGDVKAEAVRQARGSTKRQIPAPPMPARFIEQPARTEKALNIMEMLHQTLSDVMMIRDASVKVDENGVEKLRNSQQMDASIKARLATINTFIAVFQEVYDLQKMREFYQEIVDIIAEEIHPLDPEVSANIMLRLSQLNARESLTIHASVS